MGSFLAATAISFATRIDIEKTTASQNEKCLKPLVQALFRPFLDLAPDQGNVHGKFARGGLRAVANRHEALVSYSSA